MAYPKVSIITPTYNHGNFIEQCILSVKNQTYPDIEHVVIDDGSSDNTAEVLKKYPHLVQRRVGRQEEARSFNQGFLISTGEIKGWLNSDDFYSPGAVMAAVRFLMRHPGSGGVFGDYNLIDEDGSFIYLRRELNVNHGSLIYLFNTVQHNTLFIKRSVFKEIGLLDEALNYTMDYDLMLRVSRYFAIPHIPFVMGSFRVHSNSKSSKHNFEMERELKYVSDKYRKKFIPNRRLNAICHKFLGSAYKCRRIFVRIVTGKYLESSYSSFLLRYCIAKIKARNKSPNHQSKKQDRITPL
jgi:glycosyltransferase involved in cell wall biosynthesis